MLKNAAKPIPSDFKLTIPARQFAILIVLLMCAAVPAIGQQGAAPARPNVTPPLTLLLLRSPMAARFR